MEAAPGRKWYKEEEEKSSGSRGGKRWEISIFIAGMIISSAIRDSPARCRDSRSCRPRAGTCSRRLFRLPGMRCYKRKRENTAKMIEIGATTQLNTVVWCPVAIPLNLYKNDVGKLPKFEN